MGEVIRCRRGESFAVPLKLGTLAGGYKYRAAFQGPAEASGFDDQEITLIQTDFDGDQTLMADGRLLLSGTVPFNATPGYYSLLYIEQRREADREIKTRPGDQLLNAPALDVLDLNDGWPEVSF